MSTITGTHKMIGKVTQENPNSIGKVTWESTITGTHKMTGEERQECPK